jgi:phosphoglycerate dehydrogenase-like enzyme
VKGHYLLRPDAFEDVYGPRQRRAIARLVEITPSLAESEILLTGWGAPVMDAAFLRSAPRLELVLYGGGSVRPFATPALWQRGIRVVSANQANAIPVAEYTLAVILFSLKHGWRHLGATRPQRTYFEPSRDLPGAYGSQVGLVSLGSVGRLVLRRLRPFDLRVIAYDPFVEASEARRLRVRLVGLEELFATADVVSLHTPLVAATRGLVTGALIRSMKPGATLVNTARGGIIRETEMVTALRDRPDLQAVLDVTEVEPVAPGSPLRSLANVVLTPHLAGALGRERARLGQLLVAELRRYLAGEPLPHEVTRAMAETMSES